MTTTTPPAEGMRTAPAVAPRAPLPKRAVPVSSDAPKAKVDLLSALSQADAVSVSLQTEKPDLSTKPVPQPSPQEETAKRVQKAIDEFQGRSTALEFAVDKKDNQIIVRVVNRASGELVRQIPPEEFIQMSERLADFRGILFNQTS